ncbi:conserved protein of unknown function [Limnospira indica PCC 8005]|uniref:Uncharacterized protein n=1 Tax=Limnospira indica PCC 8005 TaxID=376219 RepID=A0A9P1NZS7_9CYAN|nr:conserved protein of unknown function [Limnospira indica PCC 8005]
MCQSLASEGGFIIVIDLVGQQPTRIGKIKKSPQQLGGE